MSPESSKHVASWVAQGPALVQVVDDVEWDAGEAVEQVGQGKVQDEQGHVPVDVKGEPIGISKSVKLGFTR